MENDKTSIKKIIIKYGIIYGIIFTIHDIIRYATGTAGMYYLWIFAPLDLFINIGIISYGIHSFKLDNNHFLKLRHALKIGFCIVLIGTSIRVLCDAFYFKVISPETIYELISPYEKSAITKPIEQDSAISRENNFILNISLAYLFFYPFLGLLISLIAGAIMQKKQDVYKKN
ncbi:DUF4199 domain-containing protein [Aquimarina algiphila]|uniref:DUF4199 domain-containing protein n=1 Tax=Aquimarina algiphila TaxID=2047982 RepID=UPI00232E58A4|nr:DUF4199 domain-containing protein [Aquimarina algiphila]